MEDRLQHQDEASCAIAPTTSIGYHLPILINPETYRPLTLDLYMKQNGRMQFPLCLDVAIALAEALHHLHANGLVHCDIKPSDIAFVRGHPKLADIGLVLNRCPTSLRSPSTM